MLLTLSFNPFIIILIFRRLSSLFTFGKHISKMVSNLLNMFEKPKLIVLFYYFFSSCAKSDSSILAILL